MFDWIKDLVDMTEVGIIESLDHEVEQVTEKLMTRAKLGILDRSILSEDLGVNYRG